MPLHNVQNIAGDILDRRIPSFVVPRVILIAFDATNLQALALTDGESVHAGVVVALCPVWPWAWSRRRRGEWVWLTGNLVGRLWGSIKCRVVYL